VKLRTRAIFNKLQTVPYPTDQSPTKRKTQDVELSDICMLTDMCVFNATNIHFNLPMRLFLSLVV